MNIDIIKEGLTARLESFKERETEKINNKISKIEDEKIPTIQARLDELEEEGKESTSTYALTDLKMTEWESKKTELEEINMAIDELSI